MPGGRRLPPPAATGDPPGVRVTGAGWQPHWSQTVRTWAAGQPLIVEVHAFGSRVKGGYRLDSDFDLALVVDGQDDGERFGNAICLMPKWRAELQDLLPVKVHAQAMFDDDVVVAPAVREHGILIYSRAKGAVAD